MLETTATTAVPVPLEPELLPSGHPERALSCLTRIRFLLALLEIVDDTSVEDEAISLSREALSLLPSTSPDRIDVCLLLAASLFERYEHDDDLDLMNEIIALEREGLELCPQGHYNRASFCGNLAISLRTQYDRTGNDHLLIECIDLEREALRLRPEGHSEHALSCGNLASSLKARYRRTGDDRMLSEIINLERRALELCPADDPDCPSWCGNLANSFILHYERSGEYDYLIEATELQRKALQLRGEGHPDYALACGNLAVTLETRYERSKDIVWLEEALQLHREALGLRPDGHPDRALSLANLTYALKLAYELTKASQILDEIMAICHEALLVSPPHTSWRHACGVSWVYVQPGPLHDIAKAAVWLCRSLEYELDDMSQAVPVVQAILHDICDKDSGSKHASILTIIYQRLINLLPLMANPALDAQSQLQALKRCSQLGSQAFVKATLAQKWTTGIDLLEMAQGVFWSQRLHQRDPQLRDVPRHLAEELESLLNAMASRNTAQVTHYTRATAIAQDVAHAQSTRIYALLREIRAMPGMDRFMLGDTFETLCTVANKHAVVVLVGGHGHFFALILASPQAEDHTLLPLDVTEGDLKTLQSYIQASTRTNRGIVMMDDDDNEVTERLALVRRTAPARLLDRKMTIMWHKIVKPVIDSLGLQISRGKLRPRVYWCPTGVFATMPLHAAGTYDAYPPVSCFVGCFDYMISSYTPTLSILLRAQRTMNPPVAECYPLHLALVAEKRAHDLALQAIPGVEKELRDVAAVAELSNIQVCQMSHPTTVAETCSIMQDANIVHLACHGVQDDNDATQSGFCLGDGRLTISNMIELKIDHAFLAFLSACETAKGDSQQPDQAIHLAAAMLFSGFKSVIATIWAISDVDGPKVAKWFYQELFSHQVINADAVAYSLDVAVGNLRKSGVALHRWAPFIHLGA